MVPVVRREIFITAWVEDNERDMRGDKKEGRPWAWTESKYVIMIAVYND